jgi:hypothetical protein
MLIVPKKISWRSDYSGMDSLEWCFNRQHFLNYSKKITYEYNSKGFRDKEWPEDLSEVIWCVGDSFTVGLGQPYEETWPQILEKKIGKRCLNLGEDGCSNDTIFLRVNEIAKSYQPKLIVVMWSYIHRRRIDNVDVHFVKKDFGLKNDIKNFLKNLNDLRKCPVKIIHTIIPGALPENKKKIFNYILKNNNYLKSLIKFQQLDYARDYHHFDISTSLHLCDLILHKINNFDKIPK